MNAAVSWASLLCLDASFVVQLLIESVYSETASALLAKWDEAGCQFVAPTLICYEISNALHQAARHRQLTSAEAQRALEVAFSFNITLYGDRALHQQALALAGVYSLPAAYDAHYLALAQRLGAELWTADRRLFNAVHGALPWVQCLAM